MINLNEYDNINDNHVNWVDPRFHTLYSTEIKRKSFFTIVKRYDNVNKNTDYYLVMFDTPNKRYEIGTTYRTASGLVKIPLTKFWNKLPFSNMKSITDIVIELKDEDDESIVYYLDI